MYLLLKLQLCGIAASAILKARRLPGKHPVSKPATSLAARKVTYSSMTKLRFSTTDDLVVDATRYSLSKDERSITLKGRNPDPTLGCQNQSRTFSGEVTRVADYIEIAFDAFAVEVLTENGEWYWCQKIRFPHDNILMHPEVLFLNSSKSSEIKLLRDF